MIWLELSIRVPWEYVEPISYLFGRYGRGLSMENAEDGVVLLRTYLPNTSKQRMVRIEVGVHLVSVLQPLGELEVRDLKETDWENSWKEHFTLLNVGRRLVVKPSWIDYEGAGDEVVIELDPGMAFGTGYHPTTRMCLEILEGLIQPGMNVLDLGTGSGILAIAAAKLGAASVLALDIDPIAVRSARKNVRSIGLMNKIRLARGTLPHKLAQEGGFDLALANISSRVLEDKVAYLREALKPGGLLLASGVIQKQQRALNDTIIKLGFSHVKIKSIEDWVAMVLSRVG